MCRDDLSQTGGKRLPCGHILHSDCLRSWLQQDPTCPLCRKSVIIERLVEVEPEAYRHEYQRFLMHNPHAQPFRPPAQQQPPAPQQPPPQQPLPEVHGHHAMQHRHHEHEHGAPQQQQQRAAATSPSNAEVLAQLEAVRSQLDFVQTLVLAQQEQTQRVEELLAALQRPPSEAELREKRLAKFAQ